MKGEIAIAKRIEAGREMMIGGMCESPLAIALIAWNILKANQLREVIDLDATSIRGQRLMKMLMILLISMRMTVPAAPKRRSDDKLSEDEDEDEDR